MKPTMAETCLEALGLANGDPCNLSDHEGWSAKWVDAYHTVIDRHLDASAGPDYVGNEREWRVWRDGSALSFAGGRVAVGRFVRVPWQAEGHSVSVQWSAEPVEIFPAKE